MTSEKRSILVIDDEANMRHMLQALLKRHGYTIETAEDGAQGLEKIKNRGFDFVLCDVRMPKMDGMGFLEAGQPWLSQTTVIMMSAYGTLDMAIEAMKRGAYDVISKPFKDEEIRLVLKKAEERELLRQENSALKNRLQQISGDLAFDTMVGKSPAMREVFAMALKVARFDSTVLIIGESGTGKELIAQGIHRESPRRSGPMVPVNCASIPETLMESELFGHVKGAFTGADKDKKGLFELAREGTIFLDEIGEIQLLLQPKILRVLQENEIRPVGGTKTIKINVRVIAATSRDLSKAIADGQFREDLFYRLNVVPILLPPLRKRKDDIPRLSRFFINRFNETLGTQIKNISPAAMDMLMGHDWPGNVRELENAMERAIVLAETDTLTEDLFFFQNPVAGPDHPDTRVDTRADAQVPGGDDDAGFSLKAAKAELEERMIRAALSKTDGNRTHAAALLEISHPSLLSKMKQYGIT